jgi:uncharacterized protein
MMNYKDANIQILDVPGIIGGAERGRGRGREVLSVARGSDLIILITDAENIGQIEKIRKSLYENGIRLDTEPPNVLVEKKLRGNIVLHSNMKQDLDAETVKEVAREFGFKNAEITVKEKLTMDRLIDAFSGNRVYLPSFVVINKIDINKNTPFKGPSFKAIGISAEKNINLDQLKTEMWKSLNFARVYLVRKDEKPNFNNPLVVKRGKTIDQVALEIGTEFAEGKLKAKIWGNGAKFPGQTVSLSTTALDGMQIRFV